MSVHGHAEPRDALRDLLERHLGGLIADAVIESGCRRSGFAPAQLRWAQVPRLVEELVRGVRLFVREPRVRDQCIAGLNELCSAMKLPVSAPEPDSRVVEIRNEPDVVEARGIARLLCGRLGFSTTDQVKVATVVSELSRNIVQYARAGKVTISTVREGARRGVKIIAEDQGPGIEGLDRILAGRHVSRTGMGRGLHGSSLLMDTFDVVTGPNGTKVTTAKYFGH